jgi:hypothetical protein
VRVSTEQPGSLRYYGNAVPHLRDGRDSVFSALIPVAQNQACVLTTRRDPIRKWKMMFVGDGTAIASLHGC